MVLYVCSFCAVLMMLLLINFLCFYYCSFLIILVDTQFYMQCLTLLRVYFFFGGNWDSVVGTAACGNWDSVVGTATSGNWDSVVGTATCYGLDRIPGEAKFSTLILTNPGAHPVSCTMGTRSLFQM